MRWTRSDLGPLLCLVLLGAIAAIWAPESVIDQGLDYSVSGISLEWDVEALDDPPSTPLVAIQAGHWRSTEAPDELAGLRGNGTQGGGKREWEVTLEIATLTAAILEEMGIAVEILPTTIPPGYRADLFIALHADGNISPSASGFSVAPPRRDATGAAAGFADILAATYQEATGLRRRAMTRRMQGYYAFNSRRYQHALDPNTVGVILETGFLTSPTDRRVIVDEPERSARGIAEAIQAYLGALTPEPPPSVVSR